MAYLPTFITISQTWVNRSVPWIPWLRKSFKAPVVPNIAGCKVGTAGGLEALLSM